MTPGAAHGFDSPLFNPTEYVENIAGHALVGCASSSASGGSCASGALSGGVGSALSPISGNLFPNASTDLGQRIGGTVVEATAGGLASVAAGGKFANGAVTGAFGYLFNYLQHVDGLPIQAGSNAKPDFDSSIADKVAGFFKDLASQGISVELASGFRTSDQQAQHTGNKYGGAQAGNSLHEAGFAFDIGEAATKTIIDTAAKYGFKWGGTFSRPDPIHFYYDPFPNLASRQNFIPIPQAQYQMRR